MPSGLRGSWVWPPHGVVKLVQFPDALLWTATVPFVTVVEALVPGMLAVTVPERLSAVKISEPVSVAPLHAVFVALLMLLMLLELFAEPLVPRVPALWTLIVSVVKRMAGP
jgi:hypothetical protein